MLRVLLDHGALRAPKNQYGHTAVGLASFIGHHGCGAAISNFVPVEVFTAVATAECRRLDVDLGGARWLHNYFHTARIVPTDLVADLDRELAGATAETIVSAVALLPTVARLALRQWSRPSIAVKALLIGGVTKLYLADIAGFKSLSANAVTLAAFGYSKPDTEPEFTDIINAIRKSDDPFLAVATVILGPHGARQFDNTCSRCRYTACCCAEASVHSTPQSLEEL